MLAVKDLHKKYQSEQTEFPAQLPEEDVGTIRTFSSGNWAGISVCIRQAKLKVMNTNYLDDNDNRCCVRPP